MQVKHECHIGMLEIYNESITDLLCPEWTNLQIREDASQGTHVENLSQRRVHAGLAPTRLLSRTVIAFLLPRILVQNKSLMSSYTAYRSFTGLHSEQGYYCLAVSSFS